MSDEAFIEAILASPEDHSLRLIYADWLEERGDLRGEFIRIEHEMRNLLPGSPIGRFAGRRCASWKKTSLPALPRCSGAGHGP